MPSNRNMIKKVLEIVKEDVSKADTNRLRIFTDYGKGWKRINFYALGFHLTASPGALKKAIEDTFPNVIETYVSYHIFIKVKSV